MGQNAQHVIQFHCCCCNLAVDVKKNFGMLNKNTESRIEAAKMKFCRERLEISLFGTLSKVIFIRMTLEFILG